VQLLAHQLLHLLKNNTGPYLKGHGNELDFSIFYLQNDSLHIAHEVNFKYSISEQAPIHCAAEK
jgi:hypothetical protein